MLAPVSSDKDSKDSREKKHSEAKSTQLTVKSVAKDTALHFVLGAGEPLREPVVQHGTLLQQTLRASNALPCPDADLPCTCCVSCALLCRSVRDDVAGRDPSGVHRLSERQVPLKKTEPFSPWDSRDV